MPMTYVISCHGTVNYQGTTTIPPKVSVHFYQNFGMSLLNTTGFAIQSALCTSYTQTQATNAAQVLAANPVRTMWQSHQNQTVQNNAITLTPDTHTPRHFNSGIVRALDNAVICDIDNTGAMTLTQALAAIAADAIPYEPDAIDVHCLFCT